MSKRYITDAERDGWIILSALATAFTVIVGIPIVFVLMGWAH